MPLFLLGLALGAVSGGATYLITTDGLIAGIAAAVAAVLTWLGVGALVLLDD
ncbi:hypothetical protein [Streptomyces sp. NRRL S-241]|uniref:hypothetical protein n=1 Tax=Streptomyces sp. NRRL S-241 TaxID=1463896 RepID=UPI000AD64EA2|nr:hypothetical protein [Streptomyces sp. NRRL S-241]